MITIVSVRELNVCVYACECVNVHLRVRVSFSIYINMICMSALPIVRSSEGA